jgi:hypothetical protein
MFIILQVGAPSRLLPPPPRVWPHPIFTLYTVYVQLIGIPPGWGYGHMLLQKIAAESNTLSYGAINLMFNYLSFVFLCIFLLFCSLEGWKIVYLSMLLHFNYCLKGSILKAELSNQVWNMKAKVGLKANTLICLTLPWVAPKERQTRPF